MKRQLLQFSIGLAGAVFLLALAFYRAPLAAVGAILARTDPLWLVAALSAYAFNLALRARRWQLILGPTAAIPYPAVLRVLLVGYGFNTIMPARLGELFRAEFFKKTRGLPRAPVLTSIVVERLFDGLAVVGLLAIGLLLTARGGRPAAALFGVLIAGAVLFGGVLVVALGFGRLRRVRFLARFPRLPELMASAQRGFAILRSRRRVEVAILTLIVYVPDALALWFVVRAAGFRLGFADTLVLDGASALSTLLPSGPAFLGSLQFAFALAIEFAGGSAAIGIAAATLTQLGLLLPVAVIATLILAHGSGGALRAALSGRGANGGAAAMPSRSLE
jgi:uncharacterized protein (TIRG00374 family)